MSRTPLLDVGPTKVVVFPHINTPHGCSTRLGGVSSGHLDSLNTGFTVGDNPHNVWQNRAIFGAHLGVENLPWLLSMTHGSEVVAISESLPIVDEPSSKPVTFHSADGCITNVPGLPLSLTVADCVPVFFYDPVVGAVGVTHAGWKGTVAGIVARTVEALVQHYASAPEDVLVGIGPSIGPTAFEVGSEVAAEFSQAFPDCLDVVRAHPDPALAKQGKAYVDLWMANRHVALAAGVPESNIQTSGWCTASHPDLFFSHRRDAGKSGRLLAGIVLRN
jgi:purine-nucleoside/S-methyl-5'-thioadenosine phosphorylase / adenosine deaminase